jgi:glycosyltransferase involved in cell wall biosynthesis
MNSKPSVSIVMNCYNGEKYLKKAIDSVLAQAFTSWEIVFWDNKSTDKSAEIFKSYKDERLNYYYADTHTSILYEARNLALKKTKGQFIAFLDADDWWMPEKLEKQIPLFNDNSVGLVYSNFYYFFENSRKKKIFKKKKLPTGMIFEALLEDYVIGSPTYVIRKAALQRMQHGFNSNFHIIGDFDLNIRLSITSKVDCVQSPVAYARRHETNESLLKRSIEIDELKNWYENMKDNKIFSSTKKFKQVLFKIYYLEIIDAIQKGDLKKGVSNLMKYPFSFNKIKLLVALFLPKFMIKKIKNY